ncbi:hypothetical protein IST419_05864 [Burkholderia multivorans]|nr:hypothetical protein IST419_05864 [Burkholderia multivorans]
MAKVPRTYSGERSEKIRKPLLCGVTSRSSFSLAKFTVPSTLTSAFSVSKTNSRLVIRPFCRPKSAAAQLIFTSSSPNSLVTR